MSYYGVFFICGYEYSVISKMFRHVSSINNLGFLQAHGLHRDSLESIADVYN